MPVKSKKIGKLEIYEAGQPPKLDWGTKVTYSDYKFLVDLLIVTNKKVNEIIEVLNATN
jgi:hypothetical protein